MPVHSDIEVVRTVFPRPFPNCSKHVVMDCTDTLTGEPSYTMFLPTGLKHVCVIGQTDGVCFGCISLCSRAEVSTNEPRYVITRSLAIRLCFAHCSHRAGIHLRGPTPTHHLLSSKRDVEPNHNPVRTCLCAQSKGRCTNSIFAYPLMPAAVRSVVR